MKRRSAVEELFNDFVDSIKEKQEDIGKTINDYTSNLSPKPNMDIIEDDENIMVITDLPGLKKENIKIDLTEDSIEITAQCNEENQFDNHDFVRRERTYNKLNRIVSLPEKVDIHGSSAKFENGVLTVVLPKLENKTGFDIPVD